MIIDVTGLDMYKVVFRDFRRLDRRANTARIFRRYASVLWKRVEGMNLRMQASDRRLDIPCNNS